MNKKADRSQLSMIDNESRYLTFQDSILLQRSIFRQIRIPMVGSLEFQRP